MGKLTVTREFHVCTEGRGRKRLRGGSVADPVIGVPRVAKLMALAIRFDELIRDGVVADQAELAKLGRVTRARLTQIMNMLNLSPAIQEQLLFLPGDGADQRANTTERQLRRVSACVNWGTQREMLRRKQVALRPSFPRNGRS